MTLGRATQRTPRSPRKPSSGKPAPRNVERVMRALAQAISGLELPAVEKISEEQAENPFQILIATILSARTQDATTHAASTRLFTAARTPRTLARLSVKEIERLIYPVSFYRHKARYVKACCEMLVARRGGKVPSTMDELVKLPGGWPQDREPGDDSRLSQPPEYLRGYARAPDLEPAWMGCDDASRRN